MVIRRLHVTQLWLSQSRAAADFARVVRTRRSRVAGSIRLDHPRRVRTFTARRDGKRVWASMHMMSLPRNGCYWTSSDGLGVRAIVAVVEPANVRRHDDPPDRRRHDRARDRRLLLQGQVGVRDCI